jgi:hypothetical protein
MSRTPATIRQADVARVIRAAKQAGAAAVNLLLPGGGSFRIDLEAEVPGGKPNISIEPRRQVRL